VSSFKNGRLIYGTFADEAFRLGCERPGAIQVSLLKTAVVQYTQCRMLLLGAHSTRRRLRILENDGCSENWCDVAFITGTYVQNYPRPSKFLHDSLEMKST